MENCLQIWQYKGIKVKFETAIDNFELISNLGLGNYVPSVKWLALMSYNLPVPVWYLLLISENSTLFSDIFSLFSSMVNSVSIRVLLSYRKFGSGIYFFYQVSLHFILGRKREGELNLPVPCLNLFPPRSWGRWPPRPHPYLLSEWVWGHRRKTRSTWHAESWHADDLLLDHH